MFRRDFYRSLGREYYWTWASECCRYYLQMRFTSLPCTVVEGSEELCALSGAGFSGVENSILVVGASLPKNSPLQPHVWLNAIGPPNF